MSSSSSSSASSSRNSSPEPPKKRKRAAQDESDADSDSDSDNDEPQPATETLPIPVDEPVLSHKQKRMQKKKEKEEAKAASKKKRKLPDGSAVSVKDDKGKRQNSVWVGNLNFKTTPEALSAFFKDAGEVTRINMPHKTSTVRGVKPENKGYAYVDFASPDAKTIAITMSEQNLLGRKLLIKDGDDFAGRPTTTPTHGDPNAAAAAAGVTGLTKSAQRILRAQQQPPAPTLFLGNLPFETTEDSIRELFQAHRKKVVQKVEDEGGAGEDNSETQKESIRKVRMGTFEDSGLCKGFAFVDFISTQEATNALVNPRNHHLNGRDLKVEYASADAVRRGQPKERNPDGAPKRYKEPKRLGPRAEKRVKKEETDFTEVEQKEDKQSRDRSGGKPYKKGWKSREEQAASEKGPKSRPRPGAALAQAKRESTAIVPAQGKKIVF
ncbi:hypothetical protein MIND_00774900 [Mycena indigotica]|uniref:RRM domain-containing protein n=1 Tax=Mycena indigotica TaxID=2126181 RepID=A0A8H6SPN7_9AGAR|nr:uncharacterized protein MIND_00774900 [Mycena indigotica]KAF7302082.1 hypothetical protein MIND_00774900 [Mycena indigotica]